MSHTLFLEDKPKRDKKPTTRTKGYKMNIHRIINYKANNKQLNWDFKTNNFTENVNDAAMKYSLDLRLMEKKQMTLNGGSYYCHDCSHDRHKAVNHYIDQSFNEFKIKYQTTFNRLKSI